MKSILAASCCNTPSRKTLLKTKGMFDIILATYSYKSITSIRRRPQFSLQRVASVVQTHLAVPEASRARV